MIELIYSIMPGVAELPNIHPMLVHFPIAFLHGFLLMAVLGFTFKKEEFMVAARWMLYLGTLGAFATVVSGVRAESTLPHSEAIHEILLTHKKFGITVLVISVVLSGWLILRERVFKGPERVAHLVLAAIAVTVMIFGADKGGLMVYKYGAGVKAVPVAEGHDHAVGDNHYEGALDDPTGEREGGHDHGEHSHEKGGGI